MILHSLLIAATTTTTATSKKSSSGSYGFLIIIVILVGFYFLFIRPRSQRQRQSRQQASTMDIGDAVMSVGGIKGTVVGLEDDGDVRVEVSPGVVLTFVRRAVNLQPGATPQPADEPPGVFHGEGGGDGGDQDFEGRYEQADPDQPAFPHDDFDDAGGALDGGSGPVAGDDPEDRPGTGTEGP